MYNSPEFKVCKSGRQMQMQAGYLSEKYYLFCMSCDRSGFSEKSL